MSVLVDAHNHEHFIRKAINSTLEQDFPELDREILVIDDGSTDHTREIVRTFQPWVHLYPKDNGGQASAFNLGIPKCRGDIIAFLDGDDWWEPYKLRAVVHELDMHPEIGTIGHGIYEANENGRQLREITPNEVSESHLSSTTEGLAFLPLRTFLGTSRLTIRKRIASRALPLPLDLRIEADEFLSTVTTAMGGSRILKEPLANYRMHSRNLFQFSQFDPQRLKTKYDALTTIANELPPRLLPLAIPSNVVRILTEANRLDAQRIRLSLGQGWPWETVRTEHSIFRRTYQKVSLSKRFFHLGTLFFAGLVPPKLFYRLGRFYFARTQAKVEQYSNTR